MRNNQRFIDGDGLLQLINVIDRKHTTAWPGPNGLRNEHRIRIEATPEVIWTVLADVGDWPSWSTLYPKASGTLRLGTDLTLGIGVPGMPVLTGTARVEECVPGRRLVFLTAGPLGGLFSGKRYFSIEATDDGSCVVCDGEVITGPGGVVSRAFPGRVYNGLKALNEGLKREVG